MKRLVLATYGLLLLAPDMAYAQQVQSEQHWPSQRPGRPDAQPARPPQPGRPDARPTRPPQPGRPDVQPVRPPQPGRPDGRPSRPPETGRPPHYQPVRPPEHVRPPSGRPPYRPGHGRPPGFRPIDRPPFVYPHGWGYRRWQIGLSLPALFLATRYYFYDYDVLGVGPPPPGCVWVRYGPDLLLVRRGDGRIVDVIYGAFY